MAYLMYGELKFPAHKGRQEFKIRRFSSVKIDTSWQSLTDTAEITIPRKMRDFDRSEVSKWFREGDPVEIWLGYGEMPTLEFSGYIARVSVGIPLSIYLEDEMYQLKRKSASVSLQNCTLKQLLQTIAPGYQVECDDTVISSSIRYPKMPVSAILDDLKNYNISFWFEGKVLHAFSVFNSNDKPVKIFLEKSVSESLKQKNREATLVRVSLIRKIGKRLNVEFGDEGAGYIISKTINGVNLSREDLLKEAKQIYQAAKTPGLDGDITLLGVPPVMPLTKVNLESILYPEKNGIYYIDAVTKTFDSNGYRQVCKLGKKAE